MRRPPLLPILLALIAPTMFACAGTPLPVAESPVAVSTADPAVAEHAGWVHLTVRSARIAEKLDGGPTWDPAQSDEADRRRESVAGLSALIGLANPAAGTAAHALTALLAPAPQAEASATNPDVFVEATWEDGLGRRAFRSEILRDSVRPEWDYELFVHVPSVSEHGVDLVVRDFDGDAAPPPVIGEVTIPREYLEAVVTSGQERHWEFSDGEVRALRVWATRTTPGARLGSHEISVPLQVGLADTEIDAPAGSLVVVRATGSGRVGGGRSCPADVGPRGVAGTGCRQDNLRVSGLEQAPHGSAAVLFGRAEALRGFSLADATVGDSACVMVVAPSDGHVVVGVNDRDHSSNSGEFTFDVAVMQPPAGGEALAVGSAMPCTVLPTYVGVGGAGPERALQIVFE